jgi:CRP-like cAMP-binding protein
MWEVCAMWDALSIFPWWLLPGASCWLHLVHTIGALPRLCRLYGTFATPSWINLVHISTFSVACNCGSFLLTLHFSTCLLQGLATPSNEALEREHSLYPLAYNSDEDVATRILGYRYVRALYATLSLLLGEPEAGGMELHGIGAMLVAACMLLVGALYTALLFGKVALAAERSNLIQNRFLEHIRFVMESVEFRQLDARTKKRIRDRYDYAWRKHRDYLRRPEDDFMDKLSPNFSQERLLHQSEQLGNALISDGEKRLSILEPKLGVEGLSKSDNTQNERAIAALAMKMQSQFFLKGDTVFMVDEVGDTGYFLVEGAMEVVLDDSHSALKTNPIITSENGMSLFGEMSVLARDEMLWADVTHYFDEYCKVRERKSDTDYNQLMPPKAITKRQATMRASDLSDVLCFSLEELLAVRQHFPSFVAHLCELAARRIADNQKRALQNATDAKLPSDVALQNATDAKPPSDPRARWRWCTNKAMGHDVMERYYEGQRGKGQRLLQALRRARAREPGGSPSLASSDTGDHFPGALGGLSTVAERLAKLEGLPRQMESLKDTLQNTVKDTVNGAVKDMLRDIQSTRSESPEALESPPTVTECLAELKGLPRRMETLEEMLRDIKTTLAALHKDKEPAAKQRGQPEGGSPASPRPRQRDATSSGACAADAAATPASPLRSTRVSPAASTCPPGGGSHGCQPNPLLTRALPIHTGHVLRI